MKIAGKQVSGANIEYVILPRGDSDQLVFKAQAVLSYDNFDKMNPEPTPPQMIVAGGARVPNFESADYKTALVVHSTRKVAWMVLKSLEISEIEWDTVKMEDPTTWENYTTDLRNAGLADVEINRIVNGVMIANCLNDAKIEEARKRFLTSRPVEGVDSSTQTVGNPNT